METFKKVVQEVYDPKKLSITWFKNLCSTVNKINNTKSVIGMKPKSTIKLDSVRLFETYTEEIALPEDGVCRYL